MLDNINFMDNLNAKWNIEQVIIIFDRFHSMVQGITFEMAAVTVESCLQKVKKED